MCVSSSSTAKRDEVMERDARSPRGRAGQERRSQKIRQTQRKETVPRCCYLSFTCYDRRSLGPLAYHPRFRFSPHRVSLSVSPSIVLYCAACAHRLPPAFTSALPRLVIFRGTATLRTACHCPISGFTTSLSSKTRKAGRNESSVLSWL